VGCLAAVRQASSGSISRSAVLGAALASRGCLESRGAEALYTQHPEQPGTISLTGSVVGADPAKAPVGPGILYRLRLRVLGPGDPTVQVADAYLAGSSGDVRRVAASEVGLQLAEWGAGSWRVPVLARAGDLREAGNYLGVVKSTGTAAGAAEFPADQALALAFRLPEGGWSSADYRAAQALPLTYRFDVACGLPNAEVALLFPDLSQVPRAYHLRLVDEASNAGISLRTRGTYRYQAGATGSVRTFRVEVTDGAAGQLSVTGVTATPTRGGMAISYMLSQPANVDVEIRNIAGRLVRRLNQGQESPAGRSEVAWDQRSAAGTIVPSGIYVIRVRAKAEDGQQATGIGMLHAAR
jgi:hypothetical protein